MLAGGRGGGVLLPLGEEALEVAGGEASEAAIFQVSVSTPGNP